ncbi:MAG: HRDC domain-containing protein [Deltaproteobacteria bacterium]|nr:HRDC domain-containing protein [Deltaproteobacteria bacterium]
MWTTSGHDCQRRPGTGPRLQVKRRACAGRLADEPNGPAYVVFGNATLTSMAARRPGSEAELLAVAGVGPKELRLYGALLLAALRGPDAQ